jgi:hypothetical protein
VKIQNMPIRSLLVLLSLGLVSYLWYLEHHRLAGEGPADEAMSN